MSALYLRNSLWVMLASTLLLAMLTPNVRAEETAESEFHDRLMIRGGWAYVWGADANVSVGGPVTGIGANIDFTNTLGGGDSTNAFRLDGLYRFNDRHAVGLSWYRVGLSGTKTLNQDILINDQNILAGATTQSSLSFNVYRLIYNYSFYRNEKVELGVSPGLYMMQTKFSFSGQGTITPPGGTPLAGSTTTVSEQLTLPLPSIGLVANYNITPKLQFQSRYDFFYLRVGDYTGNMFEFYAGLEYRLFQHFAMGAAFDRLTAGLKGSGDSGFNINFSYNLAYVYATLYAF
ncbi:MAG TPA: hypothetical protein VLE03_05255 [Nitrospiraceae bacterium]|nr:hypothetical protein [Nitrospiraceae bacterium]